jgi:hypothetical protein
LANGRSNDSIDFVPAAPTFRSLARKTNLDRETAYAICCLIDRVGSEITDDWEWDWLEKHKDYRRLIRTFPLEQVWDLLRCKDWLSFQVTNARQKPLTTIAPFAGLANLRSLVLQGNSIRDLSPLSSLRRLRYLNCYSNRIEDLAPLKGLQLLEELTLANNPIRSLRVLEELPRLRELTISLDQVKAFTECRELSHLLSLHIGGKGAISDLRHWPEMLALKLLDARGVRSLSGIDRFKSVETLRAFDAGFLDLTPLSGLRALTHVTISTSKPKQFDLAPLAGLHALRSLSISGATVDNLLSLSRLPVLHEVRVDNKSRRNAVELNKLRKDLTSWDIEFKADKTVATPSLSLEVVDRATFEHYNTKAPFGVRSGECNGGMFNSERIWLVDQLLEAMSINFEDEVDFALPYMGGLRRSDRIVLYSMDAYQAFRDIALRVQRVLCDMKNDWIIWCQSLLWEAPEEQEVPEGTEDFIVWIYPDKIVATKDSARTVRKLLDWRPPQE